MKQYWIDKSIGEIIHLTKKRVGKTGWLRNNYLHAPKQTFEDVEFVNAFYLKDIVGKICTKSN
jgi:hypothetical protein